MQFWAQLIKSTFPFQTSCTANLMLLMSHLQDMTKMDNSIKSRLPQGLE